VQAPDSRDAAARSLPWSRWLVAALVAGAIAGFYALGFHHYLSWESVRANLDTWQAQVSDNLLLSLLVFFAVYTAVTALSLPFALPLTLVGGALFGRWIGTGVVSLASTLGAVLAFLVCRYLLRDWVQRHFGTRLEVLNRGVAKDGAYYLLILRLIPVIPFFLINLGMGLTPMRLVPYALVSWVGMLIGTFLYVNAGTELATLQSPRDLLSTGVLVSLALLGIVPLIIRKIVDWNSSDPVTALKSTSDCPAPEFQGLRPEDAHNAVLINRVHPKDWVNPKPAPRYNLVVLGGGPAGLVAAAGAAGLGAKVALVERGLLGGDCLNVGCVPSKALVRAARAWGQVRDAGQFGVHVPDGASLDFPAVMERMRRLRAELAANDSAERFRGLGVDVFLGEGRFSGKDTMEVGGMTLRFRRALIATGGRPGIPPIPGLQETGFLTNETVFSLTELPKRLAVIGAGPVGCELAQAFARFGSRVTLLDILPRILPREEEDAAALVLQSLHRDGISTRLGISIMGVDRRPEGMVLRLAGPPEEQIVVDEILVAAGRMPNVENLGLESASVEFDAKKGIYINDRLQTSNFRIYAAGDVCSPFQFTHAADAMARLVLQNALFLGRARASALTIPWCTYTDPEVAHVGLFEAEAKQQGITTKSILIQLRDVDRAALDGETDGYVRILLKAGSDRILGATIVAAHAGEMISAITLAMVNKIGLGGIARTIFPYPTQTEAIKKAGDAYNETRLTPFVKALFRKWLSWRL
jgi:pyruvate/2-oxoglutarate dehydrogenase complex dihydrolipoamide dehydrogenase (E3) component/uncharacterized membrane protein YdjX (TVP38/TMEM64 family)